VGSPHNKANAEFTLQKFKDWGFEAKIENFKVLYPTPVAQSLELLGAKPFKATLTEPPIKGDPLTERTKEMLPAYVAFQGDGDVTAPLVYVNYGMPEDYKTLERLGVSVKGKIVIARYGAGWRGLKPKLAYDHGAVGCVIYSDPRDDGYSHDAAYPVGGARPSTSLQRGSVLDMALYAGDPLTPGVGATDNAVRLTRAEAKTILKIPALPISYGDAQKFLESLDGRVVPPSWRGGLPITYRVGGNGAPVRLMVKSDWSLKTLNNVVATMKGTSLPDQWILRGNHRDGWVAGATDPLSGHAAMLAEAKAIGALAAQGFKPKRTITYLSWDGEEPGLLGSTEFLEAHEAEIRAKAIVYINTDSNARGHLGVQGSFPYTRLVNQVASELTDPETGASVGARMRAIDRVNGSAASASAELKELAKIAADPNRDLPLGALGSGSDYAGFVQHAGIAAIDLGYGGEGSGGGVYHSSYDTYEHHNRFVDPGSVYGALLSKTVGRLILRLAETDAPLQRYSDVAERATVFLSEIKKLADTRREAAATQASMLSANVYRLADDPTLTSAAPTPLAAVPAIDFKPLDEALAKLGASAKTLDNALNQRAASLDDASRKKLHEILVSAELALSPEAGLPGRPWYRNLLASAGRYTGYAPKTLPGVREAIEDDRFGDVEKMMADTSLALREYADVLDKASALLNAS
jgi:N-acetylated-alpha-linked acidic dipeptidase